jgi:hypothetical protein
MQCASASRGELRTSIPARASRKRSTNIRANVRKLEEYILNPKSERMRIQPISLNRIAFDS